MEVNKSYIQFLLQLLNNDEKIDIEKNQEGLIVNLYLTLLSLSNLEYSDDIDEKEKETISDFLRKLNNLKVKIQLKRKVAETNKLAKEIITKYYENINILSIYIKDGIELENTINSMDAKSLTKLIDSITKDKMNKEYNKTERNAKRKELVKLLPTNEYYIENGIIYIKNNQELPDENNINNVKESFNELNKAKIENTKEDIELKSEETIEIRKDDATTINTIIHNTIELEKIDINDEHINEKNIKETIAIEKENDRATKKNDNIYEVITIKDFIEMFNYLLNQDNYKKTYKNKSNQKTHDLIVSNIIKILLDNKITKEELNKILIPILLTYILSLNMKKCNNIDTSEFNIENIKINELYSLATSQTETNVKTTKWRNISIPNEYLLDKLREMIRMGMYYHKDDTFFLEHVENNTSDFKISIKIEQIKQFLKTILEAN